MPVIQLTNSLYLLKMQFKQFQGSMIILNHEFDCFSFQVPSSPTIDVSREAVIHCLMAYLGESTDQLLREYNVS